MLAQKAQQRQQRQPKDGEIIAGYLCEQLGAQTFEPIGADGFQDLGPGRVEVGLDKGRVQWPHGQVRRFPVVPNPCTAANHADRRYQGMGLAGERAQVCDGSGLVRRFVEPAALAFENLVGADDQRARRESRYLDGREFGQGFGGGSRIGLLSAQRGFDFRLVDPCGLRAKMQARVLQELAGHKHLGTTQRYIDVNDDMLRKAVEVF